jgi:asparagine synthase (glutamine-hydrolysing)
MNRIIYIGNNGSPWFSAEGCSVRGYLFTPDGTLLEGEELLQYFGEVTRMSELREKLAAANGSFAVVVETGGTVLLGTDIIRSQPLFYGRDEGGWTVSDSASAVAEALSFKKLNNVAVSEFRGTGYVTGRETLLKGLCQVQAGEVVALGEQAVEKFYFSYRVGRVADRSFEVLCREAVQVFEAAFARMVESLHGRTAVVPLSGGFDSRLIAVMLKRSGYEKVVCFTYGRRGNREAERSRQVAGKLGFPWHFIEYTEELVTGFTGSAPFEQYVPCAANYSSMFFMQEYFAVQQLKAQQLVPVDAVFIPGHSGDFLGGSQFAKHGFAAEKEAFSTITRRILRIKYHYERYSWLKAGAMERRIGGSLEEKDTGSRATACSVHEDWDMKEKLAKFNGNSVTMYSCFGYGFRLPYWDAVLVRFFREVPVEFKLHKRLYDKVLRETFFEPAGVAFPDEVLPAAARTKSILLKDRVGRLKRRIRRMMPLSWSGLFSGKEDPICYREITAELRNDLLRRGRKAPKVGNVYNRMIIGWYLDRLEEK